jgi:regulator of RNase E activity RraA
VETIAPQHVLVIDNRGDMSSALAGYVLLTYMMVKGCSGIMTDGAFRDGQEIDRMAFPAYARGVVASTGLSTDHSADLNVPVSCAGVAVYPSDMLVGDGDGVTVLRCASLPGKG